LQSAALARAAAWAVLLSRNLLVRELRNAGTLGGVLDGDGADIALSVHVQHRILIEVSRLGDRRILELDEQGIGVLEVPNSYGANLRSKNALWTVSPPARTTTRS